MNSGRPISELKQTHTYTTLEISRNSYRDIRQRLDAIGYLDHYELVDNEYGKVICFGSVALAEEKSITDPLFTD